MHTIATASQAKIEHITQKDVCSVPLQMSHTWEQCTGEKKRYVYFPISLDSLHNGCTGPWQLMKDPDPTLGSDAHPSLKVKGWPDAGGETTKKGRIEGWGTLRSHCDWNAESMEKGRGSMGAEAAEINLWRPLRTPLESLYFILWVKDFFTKVKPDIVKHSSLSIYVKGDLHFLLIVSIFGQGYRNSFLAIPSWDVETINWNAVSDTERKLTVRRQWQMLLSLLFNCK